MKNIALLCALGGLSALNSPCVAQVATTVAVETFDSIPVDQSIDGLQSVGITWETNSFITAEAAPFCRADLNGDGVVNGIDLSEMLARWDTISIAGDLDYSGRVDGPDLAAMLASWGDCAALPPTVAVQIDSEVVPSPFEPFFGHLAQANFNGLLIPPQYGAIQFVFEYRPVLEESNLRTQISSMLEGFVTGSLGAWHAGDKAFFNVGNSMTQKPIVFGEWATVVYELSRPGKFGSVYERTLIRDAQTVADFGPEPVEIYPAGPYGAAIAPGGGQPAPNPSPGVLTSWDRISWILNTANSPASTVQFDNLRIRRIEYMTP